MQSEHQAVFRFDVQGVDNPEEVALETWERIQEVIAKALKDAGLVGVSVEFED